MAESHELPDGWGLLVRRGPELELAVKPCLHDTTAAERVALVERIAAVASRREGRSRPENNASPAPAKAGG